MREEEEEEKEEEEEEEEEQLKEKSIDRRTKCYPVLVLSGGGL